MSNPNVGFYPTTQLNPYTTNIGSEGTFQSIMSYIYGASSYKALGTASATTSSTASTYTGINIEFTPVNSQNILINYNIFSGNNNAAANLVIGLYIDTNSPPARGSAPPGTATEIDSGGLVTGAYRTQSLLMIGGEIYGGDNSGISYTINLNTKYYLTWYIYSQTAGSVAIFEMYGFSIQSI